MQELHINEKHFCLICGKEMTLAHKINYADYHCAHQDGHHFAYRIKENSMTKLRIRLGEGADKIHLKVHYDQGYSEVWSKSRSVNRPRINHIVSIDFTDLDKLKNKLKTYLLFA